MKKEELLLSDVLNFQRLSRSRRKSVVGFLFPLRQKIEDDYGCSSEQYKDYLLGLRALDALHHLAGDDLFLAIDDQKNLEKNNLNQ